MDTNPDLELFNRLPREARDIINDWPTSASDPIDYLDNYLGITWMSEQQVIEYLRSQARDIRRRQRIAMEAALAD